MQDTVNSIAAPNTRPAHRVLEDLTFPVVLEISPTMFSSWSIDEGVDAVSLRSFARER